jgi:hypothetical protein
MTRTVALRASICFIVLTALFGALGVSAYAPAAEALFLICASLCVLLGTFALAAPAPQAIPVRVRRTPHRR